MAKKSAGTMNKGVIVALVISVMLNIIIVFSALYLVANRPLELVAGDYFTAKGLESESIQVDGREYNCAKPELVEDFTSRNEKICYGVIVVNENNQEVK